MTPFLEFDQIAFSLAVHDFPDCSAVGACNPWARPASGNLPTFVVRM
jgi:hypothetical protein